MRSLKALMSLGLLTLVLTGCGQKGPLYLPDQSEQPAASSQKS